MFDCTGLDKTVEGLAGCLTKKLKERLAEKGTSQLQTKTLKRTTETKQIVGRPKRYNVSLLWRLRAFWRSQRVNVHKKRLLLRQPTALLRLASSPVNTTT